MYECSYPYSKYSYCTCAAYVVLGNSGSNVAAACSTAGPHELVGHVTPATVNVELTSSCLSAPGVGDMA